MNALLLAVVLGVAPGQKKAPRPFTWKVGAATYRLETFVDSATGELDFPGPDHDTLSLQSAVGPLVTGLYRNDYMAENGGYTSQHLVVENRGGPKFDLVAFLDQSHQAGRFVAALLASKRDSPRSFDGGACPAAEELQGAQASLAELTKPLLASGCLKASDFESPPTAFSIEDWDPKRGVELQVQTFHPEGLRSSYELVTVPVWLTPPAAWTPWLEAAARGQGVLGKDVSHWLVALVPAQRAQVEAELQHEAEAARRKTIEHVGSALLAPATATELIATWFPLGNSKPSLDAQWAWSDWLLYASGLPFPNGCIEKAAALDVSKWDPKPRAAALFNALTCEKNVGRESAELQSCIAQDGLAACSDKAWAEIRANARPAK